MPKLKPSTKISAKKVPEVAAAPEPRRGGLRALLPLFPASWRPKSAAKSKLPIPAPTVPEEATGPISPCREFIRAAKIAVPTLATLDATIMVRVVIGNGSCDLDSVACTVAYANILSIETEFDTDLILPVFNIRAQDYVTKTELVHFVKKFEWGKNDLIFRDEVGLFDNLIKLGKKRQLKVYLVDHHVNDELKDYVVEVYDHRPKEYDWRHITAVTLLPVASCSSLIMKKVLAGNYDRRLNPYAESVEMLYGAILLDTNNLSLETLRLTPLDTEMVLAFEKLEYWKKKNVTRDAYYAEMLAARNNLTGLSTYQLLHKDYKKVSGVIICVLTTLVQDYIMREGLEKAVRLFCAFQGVSELILMGVAVVEGKIVRDVAFYANTSDERKMTRISTHILNSTGPNFKLEKVDPLPRILLGLTVYNQENVSLTRKTLLPMVKATLATYVPGRGHQALQHFYN